MNPHDSDTNNNSMRNTVRYFNLTFNKDTTDNSRYDRRSYSNRSSHKSISLRKYNITSSNIFKTNDNSKGYISSLYPIKKRKTINNNIPYHQLMIGTSSHTNSDNNSETMNIIQNKGGYSVKLTPRRTIQLESVGKVCGYGDEIYKKHSNIVLHSLNMRQLKDTVQSINIAQDVGHIDTHSLDNQQFKSKYQTVGLKAQLRKKMVLYEKMKSIGINTAHISHKFINKNNHSYFVKDEMSSKKDSRRDVVSNRTQLLIEPIKDYYTENEKNDNDNRVSISKVGGNFDAFIENSSSIIVKFKELKHVDHKFVKTTKPNQQYYDSIKTMARLKIPDYNTDDESEEVERWLTRSYTNIEEMPDVQHVGRMSKILTNWVKNPEETKIKATKKQVSIAFANLFKLVLMRIKNEEPPENIEGNRCEFLDNFFETCDTLIMREVEVESMTGEAYSKGLGEVCQEMNNLIQGANKEFNIINPLYLTNLVKGYLQNLFLVFFDLTDLKPKDWILRLNNVGIKQLTLVDNIRSLFTLDIHLSSYNADSSFFPYFNRFYTCILSLILKGEWMEDAESDVWIFILDMYSIHYIMMSREITRGYCIQVINMLKGNITQDNMLIRYFTSIRSLPTDYMLHVDIRDSLCGSLSSLYGMFDSASSPIQLTSNILSYIFDTIDSMITIRYNHNTKERLNIMIIVRDIVRCMDIYNTHNRSYIINRHMVDHMILLMCKVKGMRTNGKILDIVHSIYKYILHTSNSKYK